MNILIISQYFWPETFRINDLAEGLVERGHQVTVLTGKPNYPEGNYFPGYNFINKRSEKYGAIEVIRAPLISRGKNSKIRLALNYLSFAFFASIVGVLRCKKPDVIFVYEPSPITVGLPAIFYKKIRKVPILFWVQDLWPESVVAVDAIRSQKTLKWISRLVRFIYDRCDYILTTSRAYFDSIKQFDVPEEKLRYFPQTAESLFKPVDAECGLEAELMPKGFRIVFSGNIGIAQDVETILRAAELLKYEKEIKWVFLGDGSKRAWLLDEIKRCGLGDTVYWLGQHPVDTMPQFYAHADAMLVTLKSDPVFSLTIPAKIQSYLACAKPVLAALDGEGKRVIEEAGCGFATDSGNPRALADIAMNMYRQDHAVRLEMGNKGKQYFDAHFQRDILLQNLENWMLELKGCNAV